MNCCLLLRTYLWCTGKQILMYCTAGVRCERASAFMRNKGIENVFQLEGGIHRYLDAYPEDGKLLFVKLKVN